MRSHGPGGQAGQRVAAALVCCAAAFGALPAAVLGAPGAGAPAPSSAASGAQHAASARGAAGAGVAASLPDTAFARQACDRFLPRLPRVNRAVCEAAALAPSGATSRQGVPLYWRDVGPPPPMAVAAAPARASDWREWLFFWRERAPDPAPPPPPEPLRVLVVGAIHGDELTAAALALEWIALAERQVREAGAAASSGAAASTATAPGSGPRSKAADVPERAIAWRFIPVLNPDGLLAPKASRTNARGVDLNRNFPTPHWDKEAPMYWEKRTRKDPRRWPGPAPLSEPESRFLHQQMERFAPHLIVSIHAPFGVLDFDGPTRPPDRLGRLWLDQVGVYPGSLGHYGGLHRGIPVVTIELPHALRMPEAAEVRSMWNDLLGWMHERLIDSGQD